MNKKKACRILGIYPDISVNELKKRYRNLMNLTHPDSVEKHDYPYEVYEINAAYDYMLKNLESEVRLEKHSQEHAVKLKLQIGNVDMRKKEISVHLWLKPVSEESVYSIDNISIRIDRLLDVKKNI